MSRLPSAAQALALLTTAIEGDPVPGASLAIRLKDETVTAVTGVVNQDTGVATTPDSLFQIGSITKALTATVVMRMVDGGRIDLDSPLIRYLPEFTVEDKKATREITVRHLLNHTSGIQGDDFADYGRNDNSLELFVEGCARLGQLFPPGERFSYCNAGYVVLGRLIERTVGRPYRAAVGRALLDPLGMTTTCFDANDAIRHRAAVGHLIDEKGALRVARQWAFPRSTEPAGAACATASELVAFADLHATYGVGPGGERLLTANSARAMQSCEFRIPGEGWLSGWSLAWMRIAARPSDLIGFDGETIGQMSFLCIDPQSGISIALLTNSPVGFMTWQRLLPALVEECTDQRLANLGTDHPAPPEIDLDLYAGAYEALNRSVAVAHEGGQLQAQVQWHGEVRRSMLEGDVPEPMQLRPIDRSTFRWEHPYAPYQVVTFDDFDPDGRPRSVTIELRLHRRQLELPDAA